MAGETPRLQPALSALRAHLKIASHLGPRCIPSGRRRENLEYPDRPSFSALPAGHLNAQNCQLIFSLALRGPTAGGRAGFFTMLPQVRIGIFFLQPTPCPRQRSRAPKTKLSERLTLNFSLASRNEYESDANIHTALTTLLYFVQRLTALKTTRTKPRRRDFRSGANLHAA